MCWSSRGRAGGAGGCWPSRGRAGECWSSRGRARGCWPSGMAKRNGKGGKDSHESEIETDRSPKMEEDGSPKEPQADKELCQLQGTIKTQENELAEMRQMLQVLASAEGQNIREAKILELLRKNRALKVSYEKERLRANRLKSQFNLVQEELVKIKEDQKTSVVSQNGDKESKEAREWKEKFNQVNSKFLEVQASRAIVAAEVSRLQHALQREVGEHIPISKVLEEGGDWRGRSQQISILKATREELEVTKQKLGGTLARRNILEYELKCAKQKMAVLVSKSDNDDRLINALRLELESYKQAEGPVQLGQKIGGPLSLDLVQRQHRLAASFDELKRHCYEQELQIEAQTELIDYLRAIIADQHEEELNEAEEDVPKLNTNITKAALHKDTANVTESDVQENNTKINR